MRFRIPRIIVHLAPGNPDHALVVSNESGTYELYAYDLPSDSLRQATRRPSGTVYGMISPDGRHIYYMDDKKGNETGHIVRIPFDGGHPGQDMTPSLPPYTLVEPYIDGTSSHLGITLPGHDGFDSYVVDIVGDSTGEPRMLNRSKKASFGPIFSHDGQVAVVISAERFGGLDYTLIGFDAQNGKKLLELADEASRIEPSDFSPIAGDQRLLAMSNRSGVMRPLIWDAVNGTRRDLEIGALEGDVVGFGWSPDARRALLCQTDRATTQLWVYDIESAKLTKVMHPEGMVATACFQTTDRVILSWQNSTSPTQLLALDLHSPSAPPMRYLTPTDVPESQEWRSGSGVSPRPSTLANAVG